MPDPESVGNQTREECEEGIDRMTPNTAPSPPVDLEEVRGLLERMRDRAADTSLEQMARRLLNDGGFRLHQLATELQDIRDGNRIILDEKCADDEVHCGCVPVLRGEVERLRNYADPVGVWCDKITQLRAELAEEVTAVASAHDKISRQRTVLEKANTCIIFFRSLFVEYKEKTGESFVQTIQESLDKYEIACDAIAGEGEG